jgi:hypothetical protein
MGDSIPTVGATPRPQLLEWIVGRAGGRRGGDRQLFEPALDNSRKDMVDIRKVQIDGCGGDTDMAAEPAQGWVLYRFGFDHLDRGSDEILA